MLFLSSGIQTKQSGTLAPDELRLCIIFLLKGRVHDFVSWWAIKCSSWTQVNVGTSARAACASLGDLLKASVLEANKMLERTGLAGAWWCESGFQILSIESSIYRGFTQNQNSICICPFQLLVLGWLAHASPPVDSSWSSWPVGFASY